jgi:hypothetical protein
MKIPVALPRFQVVQSELTRVLGLVTATTYGRSTWVSDRWTGYLMEDMSLILGRWSDGADLWKFTPTSKDNVQVILGRNEWSILDAYWGERAEIVLDLHRHWHKARFRLMDAIRFRRKGSIVMTKAEESEVAGAELVDGGWDHEHCKICWDTLGQGGEEEGYLREDGIWVCRRCYDTFVEPHSLDFIPAV